jgi:hypothetical protein
MEAAAEKVLKAEEAAGVAAALNEFADAKEELMKGCDPKKSKGDCDKAQQEKCKAFSDKIAPKIEQYKDDLEVGKAAQRLDKSPEKESKQ